MQSWGLSTSTYKSNAIDLLSKLRKPQPVMNIFNNYIKLTNLIFQFIHSIHNSYSHNPQIWSE